MKPSIAFQAIEVPLNHPSQGMTYWLVVWTKPSEKYEFVNWDDKKPNINGKMPNWWQPFTTNQLNIETYCLEFTHLRET